MTVLARSLRLIAVSLGTGTVESVVTLARAAFRGGATAFWIRERERSLDEQCDVVRRVRGIADEHGGMVLVSGADARLLDAGAHALQLGRHEPSPSRVRASVGPAVLLGASIHDPVEAGALAAIDFAILAPVFAVPGKGVALGLPRFGELVRAMPMPVVGLGGIDATNAADVIRAGACGVAVQRCIAGAREPLRAAEELRRVIDATC